MSIQNEINRINNDLDTQTDLIASIKFALQSKGYIVTAVMAAGEVWYKATNTNKADITTINIEKSYTPSTYDECWDASASGDGSVMAYVEGNKLTIAGDGSSRIKLSPNMRKAFSDFTSVTSINNIDLLDTSDVTNMSAMFQCSIGLTELDLSKWDVSNVTSMAGMFAGHSSVGEMSLTSIGDVSKWDTSRVESMGGMFQKCTSLQTLNVADWNTSSVTDMRNMFYECIALTELDVATKKVNEGTENEYTAWDVSNVSKFNSMFSMGSYNSGSASRPLAELDVSNWDTSSATDMSFMFYACRPQTRMVDLSNWDVSKVTTFDHMFAHSFLTIGDTSNWRVTTACTNLNALFLSVQNTSLNVSGFDTSNVTVFEQMFQGCIQATEIIGLENFDTSNSLGFSEMFQNCWKLKKLDLSSFDTTKAKDGAPASTNGTVTNTLNRMFDGMRVLEEITLGANFSFDGDGTSPDSAGILPTPDSSYISGADGNWYTADGTAYTPAEIQAMDNPAGTYYAVKSVTNG